MSSKAMSLKARIRNVAKEKNISAQALLQNYMFECFLNRLSKSEYRDKFVIKGGMLIAAIVGLDVRSTMDLDTTIQDLSLTEASIRGAVGSISAVDCSDNVLFEVGVIVPIRPDDLYGGYRVSLMATYETIETPLSIDVTTDDVITPRPFKFSFPCLFDDEKSIDLWAYTIETVMAEKIETILRRNVFNTRPRDFYDIHILNATQPIDIGLLKEALEATATHRGTSEQIEDKAALLDSISASSDLRTMWLKYKKQFSYAQGIEFEEIIDTLRGLCDKL
jgi:predicted nucleotidyltransferase component of viral defense system